MAKIVIILYHILCFFLNIYMKSAAFVDLVRGKTFVSKRKPIDNIDNIAHYIVLHNGIYILYKKLLSSKIVKKISFIY